MDQRTTTAKGRVGVIVRFREVDDAGKYLRLPTVWEQSKWEALGFFKYRITKKMNDWKSLFLNSVGKEEVSIKRVILVISTYTSWASSNSNKHGTMKSQGCLPNCGETEGKMKENTSGEMEQTHTTKKQGRHEIPGYRNVQHGNAHENNSAIAKRAKLILGTTHGGHILPEWQLDAKK